MVDYYKILGLRRNCSDQEILTAWKNLARQYHPDKNKSPEAEEKFKEIKEAYEVLSDPQKKLVYDCLGDEEDARRFKDFFGNDLSKLKAPDRYITLDVPLEEIYMGKVRKEYVQKKIVCSTCKAKESACDICLGSGTETINKVYEVVIKKGMDTGTEICITGGENEAAGLLAGDLIFVVRIKLHPKFTKAGRKDLITFVNLQANRESDAVLQVYISTLDERTIEVNIPNGEKKVEIENEGLPEYNDPSRKGKLTVFIKESEVHAEVLNNLNAAASASETESGTKYTSSNEPNESTSEVQNDPINAAASASETESGTKSTSSTKPNEFTAEVNLDTAAPAPETEHDAKSATSSKRTNKSRVPSKKRDLTVSRKYEKLPWFICCSIM